MSELSDLFAAPSSTVSTRRARVISVSGRNLVVDLGGAVTIPAVASCNPVPDQSVLIAVEGSSMTAIAAIGGVNRQATLTATSSTTTTVTGLLNGASRAVTKAGAFTVTAGDELPLLWAADGSDVWVLGKAGVPYVPPPSGGGGGGGGGVKSGTATYAATWSGSRESAGSWQSGSLRLGSTRMGGFFYGSSRFRELQGRTITGFRVNIVRASGGGSVSVFSVSNSGPGAVSLPDGPTASVSPGGWRSLPIGMANWMISGSGTGGLVIPGGSGTLRGLPYGTLQFDWRK